MPDNTTKTTEQLLSDTDQYAQQQGMADIITELKARIIKQGDSDDDSGHRGGVRPNHHPIV